MNVSGKLNSSQDNSILDREHSLDESAITLGSFLLAGTGSLTLNSLLTSFLAGSNTLDVLCVWVQAHKDLVIAERVLLDRSTSLGLAVCWANNGLNFIGVDQTGNVSVEHLGVRKTTSEDQYSVLRKI